MHPSEGFVETYPPDLAARPADPERFAGYTHHSDEFVETYAPDLPYVDHGPEILARDHAPDTARIDQTLTDAGAPASQRWSARMNANREAGRTDTPGGLVADVTPITAARTATPITAARTATPMGIAQLPPSVPQTSPPVR